MGRRSAPLLLVLVVGMAGCRPNGPRPLRRGEPHHLALGTRERGEARFLTADLSQLPPVWSQVVVVPDAATAARGSPDEPLATNVGAELFVLARSGPSEVEVVRVAADGRRSRLRTSLKIAPSQLTPRPLRVVDGRLFLVTEEAVFSTRLDESRDYLEPVDTAGHDHFATLGPDLVTAHDMRVGDVFDWKVLRLRGSGSLEPVGRLAGDLLRDVVSVDGADLSDGGVLFLPGAGELRSITVTPGRRVAEADAVLAHPDHGVRGLVVLDQELIVCSRRLFALPVSFDADSSARRVDDGFWCGDLMRRGPVWALGTRPRPRADAGLAFRPKDPQELVRLELDGAGRAVIVLRHPVPAGEQWTSLVR